MDTVRKPNIAVRQEVTSVLAAPASACFFFYIRTLPLESLLYLGRFHLGASFPSSHLLHDELVEELRLLP
jgi:hypothetical protein